jgi:hypothetical protein
MSNTQTAEEIANTSLAPFNAKDMRGWSELCDLNVIVNYREYWDPMAFTKATSSASFNSLTRRSTPQRSHCCSAIGFERS